MCAHRYPREHIILHCICHKLEFCNCLQEQPQIKGITTMQSGSMVNFIFSVYCILPFPTEKSLPRQLTVRGALLSRSRFSWHINKQPTLARGLSGHCGHLSIQKLCWIQRDFQSCESADQGTYKCIHPAEMTQSILLSGAGSHSKTSILHKFQLIFVFIKSIFKISRDGSGLVNPNPNKCCIHLPNPLPEPNRIRAIKLWPVISHGGGPLC